MVRSIARRTFQLRFETDIALPSNLLDINPSDPTERSKTRSSSHIAVIGGALRRSGDSLIQLDLDLRRRTHPGMERKALGGSSTIIDRKQIAKSG
jgi:hypothetical protein